MATDSSGFNTSSAYTPTNYDPTNNALVNGLQSAATYDPTAQSTALPTSAARYVSGGLNSPNDSTSDNASTTQGLQSTNGYGNNTYALSGNTVQSTQNAGTYGLTAKNNNALNSNYSSTLPTTSKLVTSTSNTTANTGTTQTTPSSTVSASNGYTVSVGNPANNPYYNGALNPYTAAQNQQTSINSLTQYGGAQVVAVSMKGGGTAYYQFNSSNGTYTLAQLTDKKGNVTYGGELTAVDQNGNSVAVPPALTDAQRAGAQVQSIAGTQITADNAQSMGSAVTQSSTNAQAIAAWNKANQAQYTQNQAAAATAAQSAAETEAINYMTTHNGQLPPDLQTIANNTYAGNATIPQAQQAGIAAAQQTYAANQAHSATLTGLNVAPIDTSASDATDVANQNSLLSQLSTQSGGATGGVAGRAGAFQSAALTGQASLDHDTAAAKSYDANLTNFANALSSQNSYDQQATGNQLYSDIQGVQQIAAQLQQEMGQLGTKAQNAAQGQLDNLNQTLTNYQQAVNEYGQYSSQAMGIAKGILAAAGTLAAALV